MGKDEKGKLCIEKCTFGATSLPAHLPCGPPDPPAAVGSWARGPIAARGRVAINPKRRNVQLSMQEPRSLALTRKSGTLHCCREKWSYRAVVVVTAEIGMASLGDESA
jgi:hypothetical protein